MKFQFIDDHRNEFPVNNMCKVLQVSPSGYHVWRGRPPSKREIANRRLYEKIKRVYNEIGGIYGSPRIYEGRKERGVASSENRVARVMRSNGLRAGKEETFRTTTKRNDAD